MKLFRVAFAVIGLICLTASNIGCTGVQQVGKVGDTTYYNVHAENLGGPNISALVAETGGKARVVQSFGGPGLATSIAPAAVTAAGDVAAANTFGANLRPDRVNVNSASNGGDSSATGGAGGSGGAGGGGGKVDQSKVDNHVDNRVDKSVREDNRTNNVNIGK